MKRLLIVPLAVLALATTARAADAAAAPAKPATDEAPTMTKSGPGQATSHRVINVKAKVLAVDQEKRTLTLEGKDGKPETFAVSSKVKRLNEIAPGDFIVVKYEQGVALQFQPEGEKGAEPAGMVQLDKAGAEKAPSAGAHAQVRGTVTVKAVDQKTRTVTLETAKGEELKVKADPSINLKNVKPGQKYTGTYSESLAVSVEKAKPAESK